MLQLLDENKKHPARSDRANFYKGDTVVIVFAGENFRFFLPRKAHVVQCHCQEWQVSNRETQVRIPTWAMEARGPSQGCCEDN